MLVFLSLIAIIIIIYLIKETRKPANFPPGPSWLPIVGNLPLLKNLSKSLGGQQHALSFLAKKYNTNVLGLKLGKDYVIVVFSYPIVRDVLISEDYEGRPNNFFLRLRCMGKKNGNLNFVYTWLHNYVLGVTCTDGDLWHSQRNFLNRHLRNLGFGQKPMEVMIKDELIEILSILDNNNDDISIDKFLAPGVINVLWALTTGQRLSRNNNQLNELLDLFNLRSKAFDMTGGTLSQHPWLRFILPEWSGYNLIQRVNKNLKDLFLRTIKEHENSWEDGKNDDLIYRYLTEMKTTKDEHFTEDQLVMVCADLFIAGAQTTSGTLNFAFLLMIMFPEIQKKVQEEIDLNFPKDYVLQYSDRHKIPYVQAVLFEVMRFRHVIPVIGPRRVLKDTILSGYNIPKESTVLISLHSIHNNPEYWKNPNDFNPARFLDDDGFLIKTDHLIPFGLGRRRCLGEVLAKNCIFLFFTEIIRNFIVCSPPGFKPPTGKYLSGITISPENYKARFIKRI